MFIDPETSKDLKRSIFNAIVAPRPIGWISSISATGEVNLAPFSHFNIVSTSPPVILFSCNSPEDRREKDTLANVRANSGETDGASVANRATYAKADPRVAPFSPPYLRRSDHGAIRVFDIDAVQAPKDNPRLKMLQSATMSINWVEYDGPRDRKALSPHSHKDFEQGSLALAGEFRHHLRVEWGNNANLWQDDLHVAASSPSVLIIPPEIIHTSEGVNGGRHLLIDIFSPPRKDFIAKNWIANASEYQAPGSAS
jgi:hypothetical protein